MMETISGLRCRAETKPNKDCDQCYYGRIYGRDDHDRLYGCDLERLCGDALHALEMAPSRNCVNCDHYEVCVTVRERKAYRANNYTACEHWRRKEV